MEINNENAKTIAKQISEDIDMFCQFIYDDGPRKHLGASIIGEECNRYLAYLFRWFYFPKFNGRMCRLFNRGHKEEDRFVEWLIGIGCQVWRFDENGKQFRVSGVNGHFGGSYDLVIKLPERYGIDVFVLCEFKTHNTGSHFNELREKGVRKKKELHRCQFNTYGYMAGFDWCLYMCINKNDDDIHCELVKIDKNEGKQMEMKAENIINSNTLPPKFSDDPTHRKCSICSLKQICHFGAPANVNCRSCIHSKPIENAKWFCKFHNAEIPEDFISKGCKEHSFFI